MESRPVLGPRKLIPFALAQQRSTVAGYALIILTFGVMGGWAAVAPLDRGVVAQGVIMVEDNRKVVQHFEGGMVSAILVREGQSVAEGEPLVRLSPLQAGSGLETVRNQLDGALALEASLAAEIDGRESVAFPAELLARQADPGAVPDHPGPENSVRRAPAFALLPGHADRSQGPPTPDRNRRHRGREGVDRKADRFHRRGVERPSFAEGAGLIPVTRVLAMERERTRLEGIAGRAIADTAKAANRISEARLQVMQLNQKFQEEVSANAGNPQKINTSRKS